MGKLAKIVIVSCTLVVLMTYLVSAVILLNEKHKSDGIMQEIQNADKKRADLAAARKDLEEQYANLENQLAEMKKRLESEKEEEMKNQLESKKEEEIAISQATIPKEPSATKLEPIQPESKQVIISKPPIEPAPIFVTTPEPNVASQPSRPVRRTRAS